MTRLLLAVAAIALAGGTAFPQPIDRWSLWIAATAGLALLLIFIEQVLVGIESWWALRQRAADARRRNGGWR